MAARTHDSVLKELRGEREAPASVAAILAAGTKNWKVSDVPVMAVQKDDIEDVMDLFKDVFEEIDEPASKALSNADCKRFALWLCKPTDTPPALMDEEGEMDEDVTKDGQALGQALVESLGTPPPPKSKKTSVKEAKAVLSAACLKDMAIQGMREPAQIGYMNAALFLGYHPSRAESAGLGHGDLATSSEIIRKACKVPGFASVHQALDQSKAEGTAAPLAAFFGRLADSLSSAADDHAGYADAASARVNRFFNGVKDSAMNDATVIIYIELYLVWTYRGRGLPTDGVDGELMNKAHKRAHDAAAGSSKSGAPANAKIEGDLAALSAQLSEVLASSTKRQADVGRFGSRLDSAVSRIDKVERAAAQRSGLNADKDLKCDKCGQKGHRGADCPGRQ